MTETTDKTSQLKNLIHNLYNSTTNTRLQGPLMKAYKRIEDGADVNDLAARTASAVNYVRLTEQLNFSTQQDNWWRELRDMGTASVMYHDPKNNLLDLSER
ncbi:hypothetical protein [Companilactobacillus hulinensis]|uniref:hypothetical protein n=1 Tax=Companilactobacillus hulinensis TaxID=2486007 RepID=UPI000F78F040|nr:hypothetical protein [Companilactobacillus hulinensis]